MTAAGLAAGNAVVLKPAEQSPGCALALVEALHGAGVPPDALGLLPGEGEAGAALVAHPGRARDRLHRLGRGGPGDRRARAAQTPDGQDHVKRVVAEMGGKNCVIVDSDADLDEVVPARGRLGLRLRGPEVLGLLARAGPRGGGRVPGRAPGGRGRRAERWGRREDFATEVPPVIEQSRPRTGWRALAAQAAQQGRLVGRVEHVPDGGLVLRGHRGRRPRPRGAACCGRRCSARCSRSRRSSLGRGGLRRGRLAAVRPHRRPVLAQPRHGARGGRPLPGGQPVREPGGDGRDGGSPAVRRQPPARESAPRRAAPTTCSSSPSRAWSRRTRCATDSWLSSGTPVASHGREP